MKILHIIDSLAIGGRERRALELLKEMRRYPEVESRVVVLSDNVQYDYALNIGVKIIRLPRRRAKDLSIFPKLYHLCRSYRPDIVHSWESMCSLYAMPVAKLLGIKFIDAMISDAPRVGKGTTRWMRSRVTFPFADRIIANSFAGLTSYGAPAHKSACVHNGFDFKRVQKLIDAGEIRRLTHIHTPKVIGMVATVDPRKDHLSFLRAALRIGKERVDTTFVALGGGPLLEHYRQMVPENMAERLLFLGSRSNIESYIQLFNIGLLLTRPERHGEGISNAIMEYMALAKPVIATLGGGTAELVVDQKTGFLLSSNTDERLYQYINYLLDHPDTAQKMGRAGRYRIQTEFSIERMCTETLALYRACLYPSQKTLPRDAARMAR